jgi:hypothetical protein
VIALYKLYPGEIFVPSTNSTFSHTHAHTHTHIHTHTHSLSLSLSHSSPLPFSFSPLSHFPCTSNKSKEKRKGVDASRQGSLTEGVRLSTVDLLVVTGLDQLFCFENITCIFYITTYLNEEVNCTEPSPSVSNPCSRTIKELFSRRKKKERRKEERGHGGRKKES